MSEKYLHMKFHKNPPISSRTLSEEFSSQVVIYCKCEVLLYAAKLEHGTDYLTSPPKEGMLKIFIYRKIQRLWPGFEPANSGTRGQHANH
jgi:hypothetical protein